MRKLETAKFVGQKFGRWTVLEVDLGTARHPKWKCLCRCGNEKIVDRTNILAGTSRGCRQCSGMSGNSNPSWKGYKDIPSTFFTILKKSAEARNMKVSITIEDIQNLWESSNGVCKISGIPIVLTPNKKDRTASIDRIDSKIGYELNNIQFVHKHVNLMKNFFGQQYFVEICKKIASIA